jgi:hypothetical protein
MQQQQPRPQQQHQDPAAGMAALFVLVGGAAAAFWFFLKPAKRAELQLVLIKGNLGPLITTAASILAVVVVLTVATRRRGRFLTTAVEEAHQVEFAPELTGSQKVAVYAPHLVLGFAGLVAYAYYYVAGVTRWFFFGMLTDPRLAFVRGLCVLLTTVFPAFLIPLLVAVFLNGSGAARQWRAGLLKKHEEALRKRPLPDPGSYRGRGDSPVFLLGARESKASLRFEPTAKIPSWVTYAAPSIFGGLLVFGRKGSGKTTLLLRMLDDALRFSADDEELKPAICVLDQKGDIAQFVSERAKEYGREADLIRLGVGTEAKWNPFASLRPESTALDCRQVGFFMRCAMTAGSNMSTENSFWQDNADNLIFRCTHLLALAGESVGFGSVYKLITSANAQEKWRNELFTRAEAILNLRETQGANVADSRAELRDTDRYFEEDFAKLDAKVRTTIISVVSNFHQKFMTAEYARSFGCSATTPGHFGGFREHIARGGIFVLDVRANEHGTVANALSMLAKLYYQAAVKTRDRYAADTGRRVTLCVVDEAQSCITPSTANTEGDDKYLEMSRSFRAVDVYATQQYSSITAAVGRDMAQRLIGSFNSMVVYRHNDPALTEYIQKLVGQEERDERSASVTESSSAAERSMLAIEGLTERDRQVSQSVSIQRRERQVIDAATFKSMSVFEALGFFDSPRGLNVVHFFTKPHFVDARRPHVQVLQMIEEAR